MDCESGIVMKFVIAYESVRVIAFEIHKYLQTPDLSVLGQKTLTSLTIKSYVFRERILGQAPILNIVQRISLRGFFVDNYHIS